MLTSLACGHVQSHLAMTSIGFIHARMHMDSDPDCMTHMTLDNHLHHIYLEFIPKHVHFHRDYFHMTGIESGNSRWCETSGIHLQIHRRYHNKQVLYIYLCSFFFILLMSAVRARNSS